MQNIELNNNPLNCTVIHAIRKIEGKWKPMIVHILLSESKRFGQLKKTIQPISPKVLTQQLRELENDNIVSRKITHGKIVNVTYSLTKLGEALFPVLDALEKWGENHQQLSALNQVVHPTE